MRLDHSYCDPPCPACANARVQQLAPGVRRTVQQLTPGVRRTVHSYNTTVDISFFFPLCFVAQAQEIAEAKRKAKEEEKRRKKEEAERKANEKAAKKAKFMSRLAAFEVHPVRTAARRVLCAVASHLSVIQIRPAPERV